MELPNAPIVTKTEKRPRATRSVTSSMSLSLAAGSLRRSYVLLTTGGSVAPLATEVEEKVGVASEGEREKSEGERTRKSRC